MHSRIYYWFASAGMARISEPFEMKWGLLKSYHIAIRLTFGENSNWFEVEAIRK